VVRAFGQYILDEDGQIDRPKLGTIVFADAAALRLLETIVHPIVREGVDYLVRNSRHQVVVIEAIKLLESPLRETCDVIWVVTADERQQLARLKKKRGYSDEEARTRMATQSPQSEKVSHASTIIDNSGSIEQTWEQVKAAWGEQFPQPAEDSASVRLRGSITRGLAAGLNVTRARPAQAADIAEFVAASNGTTLLADSGEVMNAFGEKAFLLLRGEDGLKALLGWKVENLVARVDDIYMKKGLSPDEYLPFLITEVEEASKELQCEIVLLLLAPELAAYQRIWTDLGYEERAPQDMHVGAWREAALESQKMDHAMFFKQLRAERVLRPI
jgi:dephospho-CoA kinase